VSRFLSLIPAHDEEAVLPDVLRSCTEFDYPRDGYEVVVIADNCTDRTAAVARAHGARCLERHDLTQRGKGPALAWALDQLLPEKPDAVVILDADCRLDPHALQVFAARFAAGIRVLQAAYVASNPEQSLTSYAASVANTVENDLFYVPKESLGLAILLRGTGMAFRRDVLTTVPWQAHSVVEDAEYTVRLLEAGIAVEFVPDVRVWSSFPAQHKQLAVQRTRWIGGTLHLGITHGLPLMLSGLLKRDRYRFDLGWTLFVAGRSLVLLELLAALGCALLAAWVMPTMLTFGLVQSACSLIVIHGMVLALGAYRLGFSGRRLALLTGLPWVGAQWLTIAGASLLPGRNRSWQRTPR
jgi:cellulose synthase/poly-beta-1,6-N-acetylglucosamine synthase-like glycosyltransferase